MTVLALLALFAAGALPAAAVAGVRVEAVALAPLIFALLCSAAAVLALAFSGPLLPWLAFAVVAANLAAVSALRRRRASPPVEAGAGAGQVAAGLLVLFAAALPLAALRRPVVDWDARSIWSFHGRWFYAGGDYLRDALGNPAFAFSHADYPPAVPSTMAAIWRLTGGIDPHLGQAATGVLNFAAVALLGLALVAVSASLPAIARAVLGAGTALGAFGVAGGYGANGYADLLWAAATAAAAVLLLVGSGERRNSAAGLVLLLVAGTTKAEGTVAALVVLGLAALRHRPRGAQRLAFAASGGGLLLWPALSRLYGARSDMTAGIAEVLAGRVDVAGRALTTAGALAGHSWPLLAAAALCAVAGVWSLLPVRRRTGLGAPSWLWAATAGNALFLGAAYVATPHELSWHLATSADRTTIGLRLLLLCEVVVWLSVAAHALAGERVSGRPRAGARSVEAGA